MHCIVIGAGPGLGEALARRFGAEGHHIGLVARDGEKLKGMAERLSARGIVTAACPADGADDRAVARAIGDLERANGPCTTLIYNAAVLKEAKPLDLSPARLRAEMDVNLTGALVAAQTVAPGLVKRGAGAILFTGGGLALEPFPEWTSLALGKAALRSLAFCLNKELVPQGVHVAVVAICGIIEAGTPFDPDRIADAYWRLANTTPSADEREFIFQPDGSDPFYNDPDRRHGEVSITPAHARPKGLKP